MNYTSVFLCRSNVLAQENDTVVSLKQGFERNLACCYMESDDGISDQNEQS